MQKTTNSNEKLNCFSDEINGLLTIEKFININEISNITIDRDINAAINIRNIGLIKVGKGIPEFTPVEIPLTGYMMHEGISYVSLKQEPPIL